MGEKEMEETEIRKRECMCCYYVLPETRDKEECTCAPLLFDFLEADDVIISAPENGIIFSGR